ncbi:MAG TPA: leucyl aminopeptidase, partial [Dyadobacter sp.]|nr:leucyl aminopeptidase [Dyadobacter sp.]
MVIRQVSHSEEDTLILKVFREGEEPSGQSMFKAEKGEIWWYSSQELWLGLGKGLKLPGLIKIFRSLFFKRKDRWPANITLDARDFSIEEIELAVNGILLGGYNLGLYKSEPKSASPFFGVEGQLNIWTEKGSADIEKAIDLAQKTAAVQKRIMDLMNAPANYKTPQTLAQWAVNSGEANQYQVTVLEKKDLQQMGMHALLAVSKGSDVPPVMIVTDYKPAQYEKTVAFVGKGVTFDTGGISIKPSANMHLMKSDMGGAG